MPKARLAVTAVTAVTGEKRPVSEVARAYGAARSWACTLLARYQSLERDGLVRRTVYPEVPVRVEYALTDAGRTLQGPLHALQEWSIEPSPTCPHRSKPSTTRAEPSEPRSIRHGMPRSPTQP